MDAKLLPFFFFSTALVGFWSSIILISSKRLLSQNFYLALCISSLSFCAVYNFLYLYGAIADFPFLFIMAKSIIYLIAPCSYLYIRNTLHPENPYRLTDVLNFMPFVAVLFILANASLRSPVTIQKALSDSSITWFVDVSHSSLYYIFSIAKILLWLFYACMQTLMIIKFEGKRSIGNLTFNHRLINWVKIFNITVIILFTSLLVQFIANVSYISLEFVSDINMSLVLLFVVIILSARPHVLYSLEPVSSGSEKLNIETILPEEHREIITTSATTQDVYEQDVKQLFSSEKKARYLNMLNEYLLNSRPFLNKGLTVKKLAELSGIPAHHLSNLISIEYSMPFQDYINVQRIEYLKTHIGNSDWEHLTLEGICWEVGFTSRSTFFRAFVKHTGVSPSDYFESLKNAV
ncbi:helix-turn-helix domain-containing protein [Mucilaginibacter jinjuensis]|uniref:AraC family transcriptional regulator n=1 Tax=Mucilaginibacter jinjuensis TaxID=1176721 RepID=A0ABY7TFG3_9SPHI|nr:AraC family transcriptional regulator [Mucilaginibacter jinjuensis]WCT14938.1 AraC family transcriptional regulator [Mucilaginibacter jinjuensis]